MQPIPGTILYLKPGESGSMGVMGPEDKVVLIEQGVDDASWTLVKVYTQRLGIGWVHKYRLEALGTVHA